MKILQINLEKGWRGGESQTLLCMEQFRQAGHHVELLARANEPLAERAAARGFTVHTAKEAYAVAPFILFGRAKSFDIIHCQTANSLTWAALLKWRFRGKLVYTRRTAFPIKAKKEHNTRKKWLATDLFVGVTRASMTEALRLGVIQSVMAKPDEINLNANSVNKANLVIPSATIPQAFDSERFSSIVKTHGINNKKIIGVVAALTKEKDPIVQIDAIAKLYQQRQDIAVLHFGAGDLLETCKAHVKALGLDQVYHFMGFQDKVESLFQGFAAYSLTSHHEGANNGIINSFFNEVPVVSTASGGPDELIGTRNERGYLCPIGDVEAIAASLNQALGDDPENQARIQAAKAYALSNHTVEVMGQRYLQAFEKILNHS